jgi:hypothetical protein
MKILPLLLLLLVGHLCFSQTTIIAKKYKNSIFVGADSRMIWRVKNLSTNDFVDSPGFICKIYNIGKFNFAVAGTFGISSIEEAIKACEKGKDFKEVIEIYMNNYGASLLEKVTNI